MPATEKEMQHEAQLAKMQAATELTVAAIQQEQFEPEAPRAMGTGTAASKLAEAVATLYKGIYQAVDKPSE